jgi:hypothetical protein
MLTGRKTAGMEKADDRKEGCERKGHKHSGEERGFHERRSFKFTILRNHDLSGTKFFLQFLPPDV